MVFRGGTAGQEGLEVGPVAVRDRCRPDTIKIILYPLSLGTASTARLGVGTLVRLKECFDARSTTHRYALDDDTPLDAGAPIEACRYLGYVPLNSWSRPGTRRVYAHSFTQASDRYYDVDPGSTPIGELMCVPETTPTGWSVWQE